MSDSALQLKRSAQSQDTFMDGVKACLPTVFGYLSIGFAAGVVAKTAGLSVLEIALLSLFLYAGSGQFVTAGMILAGSAITSIIFSIFLVNLRHLLFSASLAPYCRKFSAWKNIVIGSQITDETFGVASNHLENRKEASFSWLLGLNITAYINWLLANVLGGIFGGLVTDTESIGMDFALPAMFAGLLVLQILSKTNKALEISIAIFTIFCLIAVNFLMPGMWAVMVTTIIASTVGMVIKKWN
ncbi:branched-chain amino acid ABC transporter permease [Bacillus subtilis]|uniref:AzlC family ABC transporter permease n=1 Tax=Bacillus subtilis TaxID=1423 RepID=UPI000E75613B|nr:AzlC family ABC transporter permease [Bacillus subtilis]RJS51608.1 branched-chain amino acid ABC transporter permease [Bacillus subtilis]UQZ54440.1 branched-chain amino acid ABC transporter permease [Bacillus subtilis]UQZ67182.1 branched-chain amino acid ABC transporter permease [Bacillus subtilis PY79]UQZ71594.1 branched-chain amino acid ABC transporter permease [Bacillus subtilis]